MLLRLKEQRIGRQLSQAALAAKSGVDQSMISKYENEYCYPPIPVLFALARALGIPVADLLNDNTEREAA